MIENLIILIVPISDYWQKEFYRNLCLPVNDHKYIKNGESTQK